MPRLLTLLPPPIVLSLPVALRVKPVGLVGSTGAFATPRASLTECNLCYIRSGLVASSASRSAAAEPATGLGAAASTRPKQTAPTRRDEMLDMVFTPIHIHLDRCRRHQFEGEAFRLGRRTRRAAAAAVATSSICCATLPAGMSRRQAAVHRGRLRPAANTHRLPPPRRARCRRRALMEKLRRPAEGELVTPYTCSHRGDRLGLA